MIGGEGFERLVFRPLDQRPLDRTGEVAAARGETVGDDGVDAHALAVESAGNAALEPAGQDGRVVTGVVQAGEEVGGAVAEAHLAEGILGVVEGKSVEKRRTLAQAVGVADLVVHRPLGHLGHPVGDTTLFAEEDRHLGVRKRAVEVERDESHTRPSPAGKLNVPTRARWGMAGRDAFGNP